MNVAGLPRVSLALLPTALTRAERLSAELGIEVFLKRDDLTGLGLGGNKARGLEFLLGRALADGCDVLVTGSGPQSNWSLLAALAAQRCGLASELCFYGHDPGIREGNLALQALSGTRIRWTGDKDRTSVDRMLEAACAELRAAGSRPYLLPRGGATPLGSVGYLLAAGEIREQLDAAGVAGPATLWLATGSCGTQAGLLAGQGGRATPDPVVGVTVSRSQDECVRRVGELAGAAAALVGIPTPVAAAVHVIDGWMGPGYGIPTPEGRAAAALVARTEGVLLDPVFGAKAAAALIAAARDGDVEGPVVLLVTGGAPTLLLGGVAAL